MIGASDAAAVRQPAHLRAGRTSIVGEGDGYVDLAVGLSRAGNEPGDGQLRDGDQQREQRVHVPATATTSHRAGRSPSLPGETTQGRAGRRSIDCADVEGSTSFKFSAQRRRATRRSRGRPLSSSVVNNGVPVATPRLFVRDAVVDEKDGFALVPVLLGGTAASRPTAGS